MSCGIMTVLVVFGSFASVHLLLNRIFARQEGKYPLSAVNIAGIIVSAVILCRNQCPYPLSLIFLHCLLTVSYLTVITPAFFGESPSVRLISHLLEREEASEDELVSLFDNRELIHRRIESLEKSGFVEEKRGKYTSTVRGDRIAKALRFYRNLIGWEKTG